MITNQKNTTDFQNKINSQLAKLSQTPDFKAYFKLQREIIQEFIGTWKYVEVGLERDTLKDYELLLRSFGEMADLDKKQNRVDDKKYAVVKKFNTQILNSFNNKEFDKTSQQLFYVLLGNLMEHLGQADVDLNKFDISKDLYPNLKYPLGLTFFLFQNLTFGPIAKKINTLSQEYLQKYCALLLGLWRTVFELMRYEKQMAETKKQQEKETVKK